MVMQMSMIEAIKQKQTLMEKAGDLFANVTEEYGNRFEIAKADKVVAAQGDGFWIIVGDTYWKRQVLAADKLDWQNLSKECKFWLYIGEALPMSAKEIVTDYYNPAKPKQFQKSVTQKEDTSTEDQTGEELREDQEDGEQAGESQESEEKVKEDPFTKKPQAKVVPKLFETVNDLPEWFTPPSWWNVVNTYIQFRPAVAIVGPAGNGKTTTSEIALNAQGFEYVSLSCTDRTEVLDLVGGLILTKDGEQWKDGVVTQAFREGKAVVLDEADALDPRVMMSLQNALQDAGPDGKARYVNTPEGKVYPAGKCPIVMCMNTTGDGGSRQYNSRNRLDAASRDRLTMIQTGYENEVEILVKRGIKKFTAKRVQEWATKMRQTIEREGLDVIISPRTMLNMAQALDTFGWSFDQTVRLEFLGKVDAKYHEFLQ